MILAKFVAAMLDIAFLREKLQECVDYIRDNYDMETFTKI
jgi:hypothetical protein